MMNRDWLPFPHNNNDTPLLPGRRWSWGRRKGGGEGGDIQGKISKAARSGPMGETHSESRAVHVGLGHFVITHG